MAVAKFIPSKAIIATEYSIFDPEDYAGVSFYLAGINSDGDWVKWQWPKWSKDPTSTRYVIGGNCITLWKDQ